MFIPCTVLFALALAIPRAQAPDSGAKSAAAKAPDSKAEFTALEREFQVAQDAYYEPYEKAKDDEERARIRLDPEKEPTRLFLPRFQDLARRAKGTDAGAQSLLWIAANVREEDSKDVALAVDELIADYIGSPLLVQLANQLQYGAESLGPARSKEVLEKLEKNSPHAEVRASALFARGALLSGDVSGSREEARALFARVVKEYPGSAWAKRAEGYLFELEHLQIGMAAPDFEAVDESGKTYKLSEYRGKVVVIDFWGFW